MRRRVGGLTPTVGRPGVTVRSLGRTTGYMSWPWRTCIQVPYPSSPEHAAVHE